jgi:hypothetical protein
VTLTGGGTLSVNISFKYRSSSSTSVNVKVMLDKGALGGIGNIDVTPLSVPLAAAASDTQKDVTIEYTVPTSKDLDGTYKIVAWVDGYDYTRSEIAGGLVITGTQGEDMWGMIAAMLPMLLMVMMMSMIVPMTKSMK